MEPFDKKPLVPVDVMIALAINILVAVLGYYLIIGVGAARWLIHQRAPFKLHDVEQVVGTPRLHFMQTATH